MEKVNSERFYVPLVWLETLCFNTSTGSQGRNKVFSFQSAWTWHLLHEGFVLFVLSQLHFNSVQQCWKTWQNIPECLISMNGQTSKSYNWSILQFVLYTSRSFLFQSLTSICVSAFEKCLKHFSLAGKSIFREMPMFLVINYCRNWLLFSI